MAVRQITLFIANEQYHDEYAYDAKASVIWSKSYQYQAAWLLVDFADVFEHCLHFYLYMLFSRALRQGFKQRFSKGSHHSTMS